MTFDLNPRAGAGVWVQLCPAAEVAMVKGLAVAAPMLLSPRKLEILSYVFYAKTIIMTPVFFPVSTLFVHGVFVGATLMARFPVLFAGKF